MTIIQSILLVTADSPKALHTHFNIDLDHTNLDTLILRSEKSIGIDDIKTAKHFAANPPVMSAQKYILIPEANRLTPEAQNALLKLLEEPPTYLHIILALANLHQLLDTVISRCHIITDHQPAISNPSSDILNPLLIQSPKDRLSFLPPTTTKTSALEFCDQLIQSANLHLRQKPTAATAHNLQLLLDCQAQLNQNTNPTLTISNTVLSLLPLDSNPATIAQLPEKN